MATLLDYETQVLDLLHDPNAANWGRPQIDGYINEARKKVVMDTGALRSLQVSYLTPTIEQYAFGQVCGAVIVSGGSGYSTPTIAFSGGGGTGVAATLGVSGGAVNAINFTNFGSGYSSVPSYVITGAGSGAQIAIGIINVNTYDVLAVSPTWGNQRYMLEWRAFRTFSALMRQYTSATYQRQPVMWAIYGYAALFIGPPPDQSYPVEFDTITLPAPFAVGDYTTVDAIPPVAQDPIQYYAAGRAKFNNQSYGEAETLFGFYRQKMLEVPSSYTGRIPDIYTSA